MGSLVQSVDWLAIGPPLTVALGALLLLLADLALPSRQHWVLRWLTLAVIVAAAALVLAQLGQTRGTFCVDTGGLPACSYVTDSVTRALQGIALVGAAVVTLLPARPTTGAEGRLSGEYHFLLLGSLAGAVMLGGARDLITIVVALEVLSLPAFAMIALPASRSAPDARGAEGALKAFLFSVVSLAVMVVGIALLYGATGTLHLEPLAAALVSGAASPTMAPVAAVGAALTLAGLLFKVAAVPFHGWVPDVYAGAPVRVAAYLSAVSKAGGFAGLSVVLWYGLRPYGEVWGPALAVVAAATMTVGNLGALRQTEPVRLLAWSSIAQSGFMLVPLAAAGVASASGDVARDGAAATVAYLAVYVVLNLGAFAVVALMSSAGGDPPREVAAAPGRVVSAAVPRRVELGHGSTAPDTVVAGAATSTASDARVSGAEQRSGLAPYRGLARLAPLPGLALAFCLLGLAGLPPGVAGLVTKVVVFGSAVDAGLRWLALVMAVNVVLGLAYYLRWTAMLFGPATVDAPSRPRGSAARLATGAAALALVVGVALSVWPQAVLRLL